MKQFTDARTTSVGYAAIYAVMNLGFVGMGALCGGFPSGLSRRAIIRNMVFFHAKKSYLDGILIPFRKVDVREGDVMEFLRSGSAKMARPATPARTRPDYLHSSSPRP